MNDVLYELCIHCVNTVDGWHPYPSTLLSEYLGISLYKTRKELKKLKEQGLVKSVIHCYEEEDGNYILRGYTITDKAKETEVYKKAWEEKRELCKKCFGIDIGVAR